LPNALIRRLEEYTPLTDADRDELARLCSQSSHTIPPTRDLIREGDAPRSIYVILDGWACHYRSLEDGRGRMMILFKIAVPVAMRVTPTGVSKRSASRGSIPLV